MSSPYVFDEAYWIHELAGIEEDRELNVFTDSPISIVSIEHFRAVVKRTNDLGPSVPVDRIVFGKGEPNERHATKINGTPFRPAGVSWPLDGEGDPMAFFAQFSFAESRDHLPGLPGEVLVVFARETQAITGQYELFFDPDDDAYGLYFEWYPLDIQPLCESRECVGPRCVFPTCHGVRHRSVDYRRCENVDLFEKTVPRRLLPENDARRREALRGMNVHPRAKIGGLPFWSENNVVGLDEILLASIWGVSLSTKAYPWVNQRQALGARDGLSDGNFMMLGRYSCIDIFLAPGGKVHCRAQAD